MDATASLLQQLLLYGVLPLWMLAGSNGSGTVSANARNLRRRSARESERRRSG